MIRIGRIARPHGVRGAVAVTLDHPESESLFGVGWVHLRAGDVVRRYVVQRSGPGRRGQALLQLEGVATPEEAEKLRDQEVLLEPGQLPPLGEGEYWLRDLLGLTAVDEAGRELGRVVDVVDTAEVAVLVVQAPVGEIYVPFTAPHLVAVELGAGRVVVAPPEPAE
jgi:16S rRNA processing protein RimM